MFRLKANLPGFQMMSGPFARQRFEQGKTYAVVPDRYRNRFEEIPEADDEEDSAAAPEETVDPEESEEQGENDL